MSGYTTADAQGGLSRVFDAVLSNAVGVTLPIAEMAVFDAVQEFCRRSLIWRETLQWVLDPHDAMTELNPVDDETRVVWVLGLQGLARHRIRQPDLLIDYGDITVQRRGTALVALGPRRLSEYQMPSFLIDEWSEAIRDGALWRLYLMPNKPHSDPKLAQFHGNRFRSAIFLAKETVRGSGDLPPPCFPYFAIGRQRTTTGVWTGGFGPPGNAFGRGLPGQPDLDDAPIPINDGDASDVDGGTYTDNLTYGDQDGGTF